MLESTVKESACIVIYTPLYAVETRKLLHADYQWIYGQTAASGMLCCTSIYFLVTISNNIHKHRSVTSRPDPHSAIDAYKFGSFFDSHRGEVVFAPQRIATWSAAAALPCWSPSHQHSLNHPHTRQETQRYSVSPAAAQSLPIHDFCCVIGLKRPPQVERLWAEKTTASMKKLKVWH